VVLGTTLIVDEDERFEASSSSEGDGDRARVSAFGVVEGDLEFAFGVESGNLPTGSGVGESEDSFSSVDELPSSELPEPSEKVSDKNDCASSSSSSPSSFFSSAWVEPRTSTKEEFSEENEKDPEGVSSAELECG